MTIVIKANNLILYSKHHGIFKGIDLVLAEGVKKPPVGGF